MRAADHKILSETSRGTPMGDLLRRYWTAALLSRELPEPDGAPVRVRILGENLIAFRATDGKVGLLAEHCSHRGATLYFGENKENGLRCWYHGWKYDVHGNCIDQPNEPAERCFMEKVKHTAYPTIEKGGVVFAYLGPKGKAPPLPALEWLTVPDDHVYVSKRIQDCHWTQGMDGDIDGAHLTFLHGKTDALDKAPDLQGSNSVDWLREDIHPTFHMKKTDARILLATRRKAGADQYYYRINQWFMPGYTTIPLPGDGTLAGHSWVPIDDTKSLTFTWSWHPKRPLTQKEREEFAAFKVSVHATLIPGTFLPYYNRGNDWAGPDAPQARQPWMRVKNFQAQDMGITESMGTLYDRTKETLGSTDVVIVAVRRALTEAARAVAKGKKPPGLDPQDYALRPVSALLPREEEDWQAAVGDAIETRPETFRYSV
jgi:phenylpropionate dioxygenase-like ring-hydroxylating dioxygenase large terminal subunit